MGTKERKLKGTIFRVGDYADLNLKPHSMPETAILEIKYAGRTWQLRGWKTTLTEVKDTLIEIKTRERTDDKPKPTKVHGKVGAAVCSGGKKIWNCFKGIGRAVKDGCKKLKQKGEMTLCQAGF